MKAASRAAAWVLALTGMSILSTSSGLPQYLSGGAPSTDWKRQDVGQVGLVVSNIGLFGGQGYYWITNKLGQNVIGCEYPIGSGNSYMSGAGLWIGAVLGGDTLVSKSYEPANEFFPTDNAGDTIRTGSNRPESPSFDPSALSEQDFLASFQDDFWPVANHTPMHVAVLQRSYAWSLSYLSTFVFIDYAIINRNAQTLQDTYIGFLVDADVGNIRNINTTYEPSMGDISRFDRDRLMGVMLDVLGGPNTRNLGQVGLRILQVPSTSGLKTTFQWYEAITRPPWQGRTDANKVIYELMASGSIKPDQLPGESGDTRFMLAFGPFTVDPGDTLRFTMALVAGEDARRLGINADRAKELYDLHFVPPYLPPPPPPLKVTLGPNRIGLNWQWTAADPGINPEEYVDKKRGKVFEGYRLYKGIVDPQQPSAEPQKYVLLADYDLVDGTGYDTGLQYTFVDQGVVSGIPYYYAVTSYDKGDTLNGVPPLEGSIRLNLKRVFVGSSAAAPSNLQVAVVPNPYLGSADYTQPVRWEDFEATGWVEQSRRVQFINLPAQCTIRVYTLAGEHVTTIEHHDPTRGYEDWNLVSRANQAVASGIYLFSVETDAERQVGKFVILK
jgi:hypothetical protein